MATKPKILLVTTAADYSKELFFARECAEFIESVSVNYGSSDTEFQHAFENTFDFIYFRDPFNVQTIPREIVRTSIAKIRQSNKAAYFVDGVSIYEEMLFEDKWIQYQKFTQFIPKATLLESFDISNAPPFFIKERISSRSKGIIFSKVDFPVGAKPINYITQQKLDVEVEYRVYMIDKKMITPVAVKQSKSKKDKKVKLIGLEPDIHPEISKICNVVYDKTHFDFMGLDIAKTKDGFFLLEVNRSPQFRGYFRLTACNLASLLYKYLIKVDKIP